MDGDIAKESLEELLKNRAALVAQLAKVDLIIGLLREYVTLKDAQDHGHQ